jgi:hypothetical protein
MKPATEEYLWRCALPFGQQDLPIGRILWGGAEGDAGRILDPDDRTQDFDGAAWTSKRRSCRGRVHVRVDQLGRVPVTSKVP